MKRLVVAFGFVAFSAHARGVDPLPEKDVAAVRAVAEGAITDAANRDWGAYAKRMDTAGLKTFRENWVPTLTTASKNGRENELLDLFDGAKDVKTVLAWTPEEFFARFMKGASKVAPSISEGKTEVVGVLGEDKNLAHVLVRVKIKVPTGERGVMNVMTVRKTDAAWKVEMPKELIVISAVIRAHGTTADETEDIPPKKK